MGEGASAKSQRTTTAFDRELHAKAEALTGLKEKSALVRETLKALIERESAGRLGLATNR